MQQLEGKRFLSTSIIPTFHGNFLHKMNDLPGNDEK